MDTIICPHCGTATDKKVCPTCQKKILTRTFLGGNLKFNTVQPIKTDELTMRATRFGKADRYIDRLLADAQRLAQAMNRTTNLVDFFLAYENIMTILSFLDDNKVHTEGSSLSDNIIKINRTMAEDEKKLLDRAFQQAGTTEKKLAMVFEELCQTSDQFEPEALSHANGHLKKAGLWHNFKSGKKTATTKWAKKYPPGTKDKVQR